MPLENGSFRGELRGIDERLFARWDDVKERWEILRKAAVGSPHHILWVCGEDGGFRPLDNRTLEAIREGDIWAAGGVDPFLRKIDEFNRREKEARDKGFTDMVRGAAMEVAKSPDMVFMMKGNPLARAKG